MIRKKFDIVLMNPPFSRDLHLDFLDKVTDICDKIVSIQPATFLINIRTDGKAKTQYIPLKNKLEGYVKSCEINNMNNDFKIGMKMPCTIINIDFTKKYNEIEYDLCNHIIKVNSIYDCNLIGDSKLVKSILSKITESKYDKFIDNFYHYSKNKQLNENTAYMPVSNRFLTTIGSGHNMNNDNEWQKDPKHNTEYISSIIMSFATKNITNNRSLGKKGGPIDCIYYDKFDSYEKNKEFLENYYQTVKTSNFFHFIGLTIIIDDQGADKVLKFSPILNYDHVYTDEELYKLFNITKEEQELINDTCKKFERQNKFIKEYWKI